jgi:hypothetical protein
MKTRFFKGWVIALLVLVSGVEGYAQQPTLEPKETDVIKIAFQANPSIPLTIPPEVNVKMKKGQDKSGLLRAMDSQEITLFSGKSSTINVATIDKMLFKGEVVLRDGKRHVIRGNNNQNSPNNNQKVWQEPLKNFRMKDPGKAEVTLTSVTNPLELRGIINVLQSSSYVVKEIEFKPSGIISITVTPH